MISPNTLTDAVSKLALLRFFPTNNSPAIGVIAEMLSEVFSSDEEVELAVSNILRDPEMVEWPGPGAFFEYLKHAIPRPRQYSSEGRDPYVFWAKPDGPEAAPWTEDERAEVERLFGKPKKAAL